MPTLQIIDGPLKGQDFELGGDTVFIGRSSRNDFQIKDSTISRKQLKSTNGTLLNDQLIPPGEGFEVEAGDTITLGNTALRIEEGSKDPSSPKKTFLPPHPAGTGTEKRRDEKERRKSSSGILETVYGLSRVIRSATRLPDMLDIVLGTLLETLPRIDRAAVILFDEEKKEKREVISRSRKELERSKAGFSDVVIDRVMGDGKAVRMSNTEYEVPTDFSENDNTLEIGSLLCVPLISSDKTYGVLYVDSLSGPYGFRKDDLLFLNAMSGPLALAIENARLRES